MLESASVMFAFETIEFGIIGLWDDKIKSGHFPPNVIGFGINIISFACNLRNLIIYFLYSALSRSMEVVGLILLNNVHHECENPAS